MERVFDFRAQQSTSRRATALFVLLFAVLTAVVGGAIGAAVAIVFTYRNDAIRIDEYEPGVALFLGLLACGVIIVIAWMRFASFGGDGSRVARTLGGEQIYETTADADEKRYFNIVEEMAIASAMPRPAAFVMREEDGINAFAAGANPERAAVAVTRGALTRLSREELTGVVAHEFSHIANRDSRLNMRLMGMVFGLVVLWVAGRSMLQIFRFAGRGSGSRSRGNGGKAIAIIMIVALALAVFGFLGMIAGRLLQSAVSRRREYLADATAVQLTRDPVGLAAALKRIGSESHGSRVRNAHAAEARHMYFANASGSISSFGGMLATHPPLVRRITALDPHFDPLTDPIWLGRAPRYEDKAADDAGPVPEASSSAGPWG
ncbi:MAG: M48 family metalloprotease [Rhodospirillaceae bacterium]|nr:M48 family metalloprotease [Rhodospirillaceae bacterium]